MLTPESILSFYAKALFCIVFPMVLLRSEPRTPYKLGKCSTTELHPQPLQVPFGTLRAVIYDSLSYLDNHLVTWSAYYRLALFTPEDTSESRNLANLILLTSDLMALVASGTQSVLK